MLKNKLSLHIFRRDLRLEDNTALISALKNSDKVIPCFIFDDRQLKNNEYRADNSVQFMLSSLDELDKELTKKGSHLYFFRGIAEKVAESLISSHNIDSVYINKDYTPFSIQRDDKIRSICKKRGVSFNSYDDTLINPPGSVLKDDGKPYTVFTPFFRKSLNYQVKKPVKNKHNNYYSKKIDGEVDKKIFADILKENNSKIVLNGGRKEALSILKRIESVKNYDSDRDFPAIKGTTYLSAHHKFGTVSIREVHAKLTEKFWMSKTLISELYWRDFFTHITYHFPYVIGNSFYKKYDKLKWSKDKKKFEAWKNGKTGVPIVDAGMRELNDTGFMHNRVRMITASFLIKDLHIDWRLGERYFAQKLIDYDPAVNNGNWQWAASTGCDAQPYFRIFNPWRQQERFDKECIYIKKWVPELLDLDPKAIHNLHSQRPLDNIEYPEPIVDHSVESKLAKQKYSEIKG